METYLRSEVDWPQAFPPQEYARRRQAVRDTLDRAGLDALYVTSPANLTWLLGYDMIWYHLECVTGALLRADRDELVFFDSRAHISLVSTTPEITEVVYFEGDGHSSPVDVIGAELEKRGLGNTHVGLEQFGYSPHGATVTALQTRIERLGCKVTNAWHLVEDLRLVKSALEIEHVRRAAAIADQAMAAAREAIGPGVLETDLEAEIMSTMMRAGGGYPGIRTMIGSGPRAGTHHSAPTRKPIQQGELVFVDFCGCYDRYHVNLNRTFSLGEPDSRWTELMTKSANCIDAVIAEIKVGDLMSKVDAVAQRYTDEAGLRKYVWWVGGYALGIAVPPDWCGNHWLTPRFGLPDRPLEVGMVFNLENQFDVWEQWPGGSGCAYIETLLVTEQGLEVLSSLPRNLVTV